MIRNKLQNKERYIGKKVDALIVILVELLNEYYVGYYTLSEVYFVYLLFWELAILLSSGDGLSVYYFKIGSDLRNIRLILAIYAKF